MNSEWQSIVINEISAAIYVAAGTGKTQHRDRPNHGLVLNDAQSVKDYHFDDGSVLHTQGNSLFYLPKGSSYRVETIKLGSCCAINFEADIESAPFSVCLRKADRISNSFRTAADAWKNRDEFYKIAAMHALYAAIYQAHKELCKPYVSSERMKILNPAIEEINRNFTQNDLCVSHLAALCGVSEVYFRRLFLNALGVSPKEHIIQKRIEYAKSLLRSENFSLCEIALMCGYSESCHFSREFKKRVGVAPRDFV